MHKPVDPLPAEVVAALRRSDSAGAIRLLHKATGLTLAEAKAEIDSQLERTGKAKGRIGSMLGLPFAVSAALRKGNKVEAIRLMREKGGLGLEQATQAVESMGIEPAQSHLAPGEVSRSGGGFWLVVLLIAAAALGYYVFGRAG
jgi:ribosomal protein L7/L12